MSIRMDDSTPILKTDAFDLKGKKIADVGQELSPEFMKSLEQIRPFLQPAKSITQFPELIRDINDCFLVSPYNKIFNTGKICQETINLMDRARIFPIVYDSLMYFKEKDKSSYRHSLIVSALATRMSYDLDTVYRHNIAAASVTPCHDFGKINVPLEILKKKDALTSDEIDILRNHVFVGYLLLTYYLGDEDPLACQVAYEHHELMDGSGYPRGIRETSELVQIVTVCDIFDALIMPKPYRPQGYTLRGALEYMSDAANSGKLNADFVKLLISYNRLGKPSLDKVIISKEHRERDPNNNNYSLGSKKIPEFFHPE